MDKKVISICGIAIAAILVVAYFIIPRTLITQDDTFVEYILGNGLPQATIKTTYFEYNFLYYESMFAWLYTHFVTVNWLSIFYVFLHWFCAIIRCYKFLKASIGIVSFSSMIIYLLLFFIPFIAKVSHTTVAGRSMAMDTSLVRNGEHN